MSWTAEEQAAIFNDYWKSGVSECPRCKAPIQPRKRSYVGGSYSILPSCPNGCDDMLMSDSQDPLAGTFREWTKAEIDQVMEVYSAERAPACPVDGTALSVRQIPLSGSVMVKASCPRCGRTEHKDFRGA